jgi:hypothetical protein
MALKVYYCMFVLLFMLIKNSLVVNIDDNQLVKTVFKESVLDDAISHTDYLITIYSSTNKKPCYYFCNLIF